MLSKRLTKIMAMMTSADDTLRLRGLSRLEHLLERSSWVDQGAARLVEPLLRMALAEQDATLLEQVLYDLHLAFRGPTFQSMAPAFDLALDPLLELLDRPGLPNELLAYCLDTLGLSHRRQYLSVVERYTTHPDAGVREAAAVAITELREPRPAPGAGC